MEGYGDKGSGTYTVLQTGQQQRYQSCEYYIIFQNWTPWHITPLNIILFYFIHIMMGILSSSFPFFLKSKDRLSVTVTGREFGRMFNSIWYRKLYSEIQLKSVHLCYIKCISGFSVIWFLNVIVVNNHSGSVKKTRKAFCHHLLHMVAIFIWRHAQNGKLKNGIMWYCCIPE